MTIIKEERVLLHQLFGERLPLRPGPPTPMTTEQYEAKYGGAPEPIEVDD